MERKGIEWINKIIIQKLSPTQAHVFTKDFKNEVRMDIRTSFFMPGKEIIYVWIEK